MLAGDLAATVAEGGSVVITTADLGEADPDDAGAGLTYTVTAATNGEVRLNGTATTTFTAQDVADGLVTFQHDGSETAAASFEFTLADGGEDGATSVSGTFNLTVNEPPVAMADTGAVTGNVITSFSLEQIARGFGGFKIVGENAALGAAILPASRSPAPATSMATACLTSWSARRATRRGALPIWCTGRPMARLSISSMLRVAPGGFKIIGENAGDLPEQSCPISATSTMTGLPTLLSMPAPMMAAKPGAAYVVFGNGNTSVVDLDKIAVGNGGYKIIGFASDSRITHSITGVPDINDDGLPELLIGLTGFGADGSAYLVFGKEESPIPINLGALGADGFRIIPRPTPGASSVIRSPVSAT